MNQPYPNPPDLVGQGSVASCLSLDDDYFSGLKSSPLKKGTIVNYY
jgi:hypothetical protein